MQGIWQWTQTRLQKSFESLKNATFQAKLLYKNYKKVVTLTTLVVFVLISERISFHEIF